MKKVIISVLAIAMIIVSVLSFTACENLKIAGTYEMVNIAGHMSMNGETITLSEDLYEYYRVVLNLDGSAKIQSKSKGAAAGLEIEGTWEYSDNIVHLKSTTAGVTTVDDMKLDGKRLIYHVNQTVDGLSMAMSITLQKK